MQMGLMKCSFTSGIIELICFYFLTKNHGEHFKGIQTIQVLASYFLWCFPITEFKQFLDRVEWGNSISHGVIPSDPVCNV